MRISESTVTSAEASVGPGSPSPSEISPDTSVGPLGAFWSLTPEALFAALRSSENGLTSEAAARELASVGPNTLGDVKRSDAPALLLRQFSSPIVLILIAASLLSFALRDPADGAIVLGIVIVSAALGFFQEYGAATAVEKLLATVELKATVRRDGVEKQLPVDELVPGDVVLLAAGAGIPADCRLLAEQDLFVDESPLTGESYPVDKTPGTLAAETPLARRDNVLHLGTHVVTGSGRALVVHTARQTEFGHISARLRVRSAETDFEIGIRKFGYLLLQITMVLVILIFAINVYLHRPVLDSFLFSLALAVGLTPQLLPAIISVNLASGARRMAAKRVIVKRLAAIENFGSMDVLCSDKTGTLTEGVVTVRDTIDVEGHSSDAVLLHAFVNASFETAFANPIDVAIRAHHAFPLDAWKKLDEIPYDFTRKRLSVLVRHDAIEVLVTKGALKNILDVCDSAQRGDGSVCSMAIVRAQIEAQYVDLSGKGLRTLGVATRALPGSATITRESEASMTFLGMVVLEDPPKAGVAQAIQALARLGVSLKMITGDNALVATHVGAQVGLTGARVLTGSQLRALSDTALPARARETEIFAEIEPNQKERLILALRKSGAVVGYMGDGINDAPALHAADVSISVQDAVDVAKDAADIVLLESDLMVLEAGVREGRRTFANTLKYVFMATSANFGNMFSMAGASLFLPFLPLLPKQILLTNLLTDLPELTIGSDRVDADWIDRPRRWDLKFIRRFMFTFGLVSSVFDYLTFGVLLLVLHAGPAEFRTGWFVESVVSATMIVLVVRTRGSPLHSKPSAALLVTTVATSLAALSLPFTPLGTLFGFVPLPARFILLMVGIVTGYILSAELAKRFFYRRGLSTAGTLHR